MEIKRISIDTSKHVFTLHGVDAEERPVIRRELRRSQLSAFFERLPATEVVLEACAGSQVTSVKLVEIRVRREVAIGQAARGGIWIGSAVSVAASSAMASTCM